MLTYHNICHEAGTWHSGPSFQLGHLPSYLALHRLRLQRRLLSQWYRESVCWDQSWNTASSLWTKKSWEGKTHRNNKSNSLSILLQCAHTLMHRWVMVIKQGRNAFICPNQHILQKETQRSKFMREETADVRLWFRWHIQSLSRTRLNAVFNIFSLIIFLCKQQDKVSVFKVILKSAPMKFRML